MEVCQKWHLFCSNLDVHPQRAITEVALRRSFAICGLRADSSLGQLTVSSGARHSVCADAAEDSR